MNSLNENVGNDLKVLKSTLFKPQLTAFIAVETISAFSLAIAIAHENA